jgi:hypothetical protein
MYKPPGLMSFGAGHPGGFRAVEMYVNNQPRPIVLPAFFRRDFLGLFFVNHRVSSLEFRIQLQDGEKSAQS